MSRIAFFVFFLTRLTAISSAQTITETFGTGASAFSIDFVEIGNLNNPAQKVSVGLTLSNLSGTIIQPAREQEVGSVDYSYRIGKYEITRDIITRFNSLQPLQIAMGDLSNFGGHSGDILNRPATSISWNQAARFVNWLNTSRGYQEAYYFATTGPYDDISAWPSPPYLTVTGTIGTWGSNYSGSNRFRNPNAHYFLPSLDEWYKAAYGSPDGTWYKFSNGSNVAPNATSGGLSGLVYGGYPVSGPADVDNAGDLSAWGTMAQGGNALELTESALNGLFTSPRDYRLLMGGSWDSPNGIQSSGLGDSLLPSDHFSTAGFRVASVPQPSSLSLLALALGSLLMAIGIHRCSQNPNCPPSQKKSLLWKGLMTVRNFNGEIIEISDHSKNLNL
jgi:formylglycine-generating enzyme required for sulfatase activity